jgi:hypothetical protein
LQFLTEQRLSDQIRVIFRNNRTPVSERDKIKNHVQNQSHVLLTASTDIENLPRTQQINTPENWQTQPYPNEKQTTQPQSNTQTTTNTNNLLPIEENTPNLLSIQTSPDHINMESPNRRVGNTDVNNSLTQIEQIFMDTLSEYKDTDPTQRPTIPKIYMTYNTKAVIFSINKTIHNYIQENNVTSLETIHKIIYCAAMMANKTLNKRQTKNLPIHQNNKNEHNKPT